MKNKKNKSNKNKYYSGGSTIQNKVKTTLSDITQLKSNINAFRKLQINDVTANETNIKTYKKLLDQSSTILNRTQTLLQDVSKKYEKTEFHICSRVIYTIHFFKQLTLHTNNEKVKLRIATYANFPPIVGFKGEKPYGFEVELLKLIFDANFLKNFFTSELSLEFVKIDQYDKIWTIPNDCTLAIGGFSKTIQRSLAIEEAGKKIYWSIPYYRVKRALIYRKNDTEMATLASKLHTKMGADSFSNADADVIMTDLPPNSIIIATKNSTGYFDAVYRIQKHNKDWDIDTNNVNPKIEFGTTTDEDIKRLKTEPNVRGLMRGSYVGSELVDHDPDQSLAMFYPWNITEGIVYNYSVLEEPNEELYIASIDDNLLLFINLRIIQLLESGKIDELVAKMKRGDFDYNTVFTDNNEYKDS
jgi:ABC-type amino acid transport substrate-binding protein